jgi:hypothetical protein
LARSKTNKKTADDPRTAREVKRLESDNIKLKTTLESNIEDYLQHNTDLESLKERLQEVVE